LTDTNTQYGVVAKVTHWMMFALIAAQFIVAWSMPAIHRGTQPEFWIGLHLSLGALLLVLTLFRLAWRVTHAAPAPIPGMPNWQRRLAGATHALIYFILLAMPITGWAAASVRGWRVTLFGLFALPELLPKGTSIGFRAGDVHADILSWVLLAIVGLHICAALYHRFIRRDGVLQRMMPRRTLRGASS
jgi:cytochrome b561